MPRYSRNDVVLVRYPFTDGSSRKVRPGVVISAPHSSRDLIIVPLTSQTATLLPGEFLLTNWHGAGLNVSTAVKRGVFTIIDMLVIKRVGTIVVADIQTLDLSLRLWFNL